MLHRISHHQQQHHIREWLHIDYLEMTTPVPLSQCLFFAVALFVAVLELFIISFCSTINFCISIFAFFWPIKTPAACHLPCQWICMWRANETFVWVCALHMRRYEVTPIVIACFVCLFNKFMVVDDRRLVRLHGKCFNTVTRHKNTHASREKSQLIQEIWLLLIYKVITMKAQIHIFHNHLCDELWTKRTCMRNVKAFRTSQNAKDALHGTRMYLHDKRPQAKHFTESWESTEND